MVCPRAGEPVGVPPPWPAWPMSAVGADGNMGPFIEPLSVVVVKCGEPALEFDAPATPCWAVFLNAVVLFRCGSPYRSRVSHPPSRVIRRDPGRPSGRVAAVGLAWPPVLDPGGPEVVLIRWAYCLIASVFCGGGNGRFACRSFHRIVP